MSEGPRWKYPEAKQFASENPISDAYRQMQSMPPLKGSFNNTSVIVQSGSKQSDLLNSFWIGCPILMGPKASLLWMGTLARCEEKSDADKEILVYELMFEEAFFLSHELNYLQVFSITHHKTKPQEEVLLTNENLWKLMSLHKSHFPYYYAAYSHLRRKNWIVRPGLQYGVHYMAYRYHPSCVHADVMVMLHGYLCSYSMLVVPEWDSQKQLGSWSHLQGIIPLCGSAAKTLLLLHIACMEVNVQHPRWLENYKIEEMEAKCWHPQKHRMDNRAWIYVSGTDIGDQKIHFKFPMTSSSCMQMTTRATHFKIPLLYAPFDQKFHW